jgi:ABC-2 type transport system permease protein
MLVMLPIMAIFFGAILGLIPLNTTTMLLLGAITLLADVGLVVLGVKLFQRETILTQWR